MSLEAKAPHAASALRRSIVLVSVVVLMLGAAACGSGASSSTTRTRTAATAPTATTQTATTRTPTTPTPSVLTGPVHGRLTAQDHAPVVGQAWRYSLAVTDAAGHPLSGTVDIEFVYGGAVVGHDRPPTHPLTHGRWHDTLEFPAAAVGQALSFRAAIHTRLGSITLDWPIKVRR